MPFGIQTKTEMFIRCGRLCCLCLKQCGNNIEAAHIIDEAKGGSNDADNGIPVCFDCHEEIGSYNSEHPKGNKLRPKELTARRNRVYHLVETGVIYAQIIAERARLNRVTTELPELRKPPTRPSPSAEAKRFFMSLLSPINPPHAPFRKLSLLNPNERAFILEKLLYNIPDDRQCISTLVILIQSSGFSCNEGILLLEQAIRSITLFGQAESKSTLLRDVSDDLLVRVYEGLRLAFFEDIIEIIKSDQFGEVNIIVPAIINHAVAIPEALHKDYALALFEQAKSTSFQGAPAARQALNTLPEAISKAGIRSIDKQFLFLNARYDHVKKFVEKYRHLAVSHQKVMLDDFISLPPREFIEKHIPEDIE